jgi:hypothetical protein
MLTGLLYFILLIGAGGGAPAVGPRPLLVLLISPSSSTGSVDKVAASLFISTSVASLDSPSVTVGIMNKLLGCNEKVKLSYFVRTWFGIHKNFITLYSKPLMDFLRTF